MRSFGAALAALSLVACVDGGETKDADTDADGDGFSAEVDCDDADAAVNPDADESCDGIDNNCDGTVDEDTAVDALTWFADADGDGFGDADSETGLSCSQASGTVGNSDDCDDTDGDVNPSAAEVCDGIDNDCDALVDDEDSVDPSSGSTFYADADKDGYGDSTVSVSACEQPDGYTTDRADCDDTSSAINPDAGEVCDSVDNDCDGLVDGDDDSVDLSTGSTWYADLDADGYGDPDYSGLACGQPSGFVADSTDCDDLNADINPGASEVCDDEDNDCDGLTDDADDSVDLATGSTFYADSDGDGFGDSGVSMDACEQPGGYVSDSSDCDDSDGNINPAASEQVGDEVDQDCDTTELCYVDADADGYRLTSTVTSTDTDCRDRGEALASDPAGDCDDSVSAINPGASEVCDTVDNDCDGDIDDDDSSVDTSSGYTYYADDDGDGFGDYSDVTMACSDPAGYVSDSADCDDADAAVNPDAEEVCDEVDNDCDGAVDADDSEVSECFSGLTVADLSAGDLIITEIMINPDAVSDSYGEWFEVYNASGDAVELEDLVITDSAANDTVSSSVQIDAGDYAVLCLYEDTTINGGQDCDYEYSGFALNNTGDTLSLGYSGTIFDTVDFSSWSISAGASLALSAVGECVDADSNDNEGLWCTESTDTYGDGDYGSPGEDNSGDCLATADHGYVTTSSSHTSAPSGVSVAWELTLSSDSYLTDFEANAAYTGYGDLKLALYDDDGGEPGNLIAQSDSTSESAGNFTLAIDTGSTSSGTCDEVLPAGTYWIAAKGQRLGSSSSFGYVTNDTGLSLNSYYTVESYASDFPDPYSGTNWTATYRLHVGIIVDEQ